MQRSPFAPAASALVLALAAGLCGAQPAAETPTQGLIVRLKDAPAHEPQRRADTRERELAMSRTAQEGMRWQRLLDETGLSGRSGRVAPTLRPVGRDQLLLQFERPLSHSEAAAVRDKLLQRSDVEWVEPNARERRLQVPPSDAFFAQQWWLQPYGGSNANTIDARLRGVANFQTAWLRANFAQQVVVAVVDTGITTHPDLAGRILPGYDFVSEVGYANDGNGRDADPSDPGDQITAAELANPLFAGCQVEDSSWHGTIVAGMVAANPNNGEGGAGMHWGAKILPVRVAGKCGAEVPDIVDGMRWAAGLPVVGVPLNPNPARIINISFGGSAACGAAYQAAVDELRALGVVVVAAAGNEWSRATRPANCAGVVGVAGLNRDGFKTNYSNFGSELAASGIATVSGDDVAAAWGGILNDSGLVTLTNLGRGAPGAAGYARLYGTSFAAPQVSGAIALMLSTNPALSHAQIVAGLRASARPHVTSARIGPCSDLNPGRCVCSTATCGAGILDAEQALAYAANPNAYVAPLRPADVIDNADVNTAVALSAQDREANVDAPILVGSGGGGGAFGGSSGALALLGLALATLWLCRLRLQAQRQGTKPPGS